MSSYINCFWDTFSNVSYECYQYFYHCVFPIQKRRRRNKVKDDVNTYQDRVEPLEQLICKLERDISDIIPNDVGSVLSSSDDDWVVEFENK